MENQKTRVINIKEGKHFDVYIGRPGRGQSGYFGNPISLNQRCPECGSTHRDNASVVKCYAVYFSRRFHKDPEFRHKVKALKGKRLGCFCKPDACHGDILAFAAEGVLREK